MKPGKAVATGVLFLLAALHLGAQDYAWLDFAAPKQRAPLQAAAKNLDDSIRVLETALIAAAMARDPALRDAGNGDQGKRAESGALPVAEAVKARAKAAAGFLKLLEPQLAGLAGAPWETLRGALAARSPVGLYGRYPYAAETLEALNALGPSGRAAICRMHLAADAEEALGLLAAPDRAMRAPLEAALGAATAASLKERATLELRAANAWLGAAAALASGAGSLALDSAALATALDALDALEPWRAFELAASLAPYEAWTLAIALRALDDEGRARAAARLSLDAFHVRIALRVFASALPVLAGGPPLPEARLLPRAESAAALTAFESAFLAGREPLEAFRAAFADPAARRVVFLAPAFAVPRERVFRAVEALVADAGLRAGLEPAEGVASADLPVSARCLPLDAETGTWRVELGVSTDSGFKPLDPAKSAALASRVLDDFLGAGSSGRERLASAGIVDGAGPLDDWGDAAFAAAYLDAADRFAATMRAIGFQGTVKLGSTLYGALQYLYTGDPDALKREREADPAAGLRLRVKAASAAAAAELLAALGELDR
ncbi:MAG: hypothetical protein JXA15_10890 [Spirochaetales bacterium]|nr:hypothetical protein [Spirochaetales bacterium]